MISRCSQIAAGALELGKIAEESSGSSGSCDDARGERGESKFDKAGNLLFKTRLWSSPRRRLLIFVRLPTSAHLCPSPSFFYAVDPLDLSRGEEESSARLLFSFIKYTDPRRDSILLGGLLFVVPSPASVTGSGSTSLSPSLFFPLFFYIFLFFFSVTP